MSIKPGDFFLFFKQADNPDEPSWGDRAYQALSIPAAIGAGRGAWNAVRPAIGAAANAAGRVWDVASPAIGGAGRTVAQGVADFGGGVAGGLGKVVSALGTAGAVGTTAGNLTGPSSAGSAEFGPRATEVAQAYARDPASYQNRGPVGLDPANYQNRGALSNFAHAGAEALGEAGRGFLMPMSAPIDAVAGHDVPAPVAHAIGTKAPGVGQPATAGPTFNKDMKDSAGLQQKLERNPEGAPNMVREIMRGGGAPPVTSNQRPPSAPDSPGYLGGAVAGSLLGATMGGGAPPVTAPKPAGAQAAAAPAGEQDYRKAWNDDRLTVQNKAEAQQQFFANHPAGTVEAFQQAQGTRPDPGGVGEYVYSQYGPEEHAKWMQQQGKPAAPPVAQQPGTLAAAHGGAPDYRKAWNDDPLTVKNKAEATQVAAKPVAPPVTPVTPAAAGKTPTYGNVTPVTAAIPATAPPVTAKKMDTSVAAPPVSVTPDKSLAVKPPKIEPLKPLKPTTPMA